MALNAVMRVFHLLTGEDMVHVVFNYTVRTGGINLFSFKACVSDLRKWSIEIMFCKEQQSGAKLFIAQKMFINSCSLT